MQQFIHISDPQGAQQQTQRLLLLLSIDGTDRQTDGRSTVSHKLDSVCVYVKSSARLESEVWAVAR